MIVVNFKNYVYGKKSLELAKKIQRHLPNSIVCPPASDISLLSKETNIAIFSQHADYQKSKKDTGYLILESLKGSGAKGTLLNHSEHKLKFDEIKKTVTRCKQLKLKTIVCASSLNEIRKLKRLKPYAIAFEDSKLISTGKSITKYNSKAIKNFVLELKKTKIIPLCGAGISSKEDIIEAKKLGCKGVLIASAIANSKNPEKLLKEISKI